MTTPQLTPTIIYHAVRGAKFKSFIQQILSLGRLKEQYMDVLLDEDTMIMYDKVFTHKSANPEHNYEFLEFLGDVTLNKSIAWYLARRFPQLQCSQGVKILTRCKINLISKKSFARFAKQLYFWEFVSADEEIRETKMDKTLEDVFEAFFGATEFIIDTRIRLGAGYHICYNIIESLLNSTEISLKYEDLFDPKTRIKEIFDHFGDSIGKLEYECQNSREERLHRVVAVRVHNGQRYILGKGDAPLKADAQQRASEQAIEALKNTGFVKPISSSYSLYCENVE